MKGSPAEWVEAIFQEHEELTEKGIYYPTMPGWMVDRLEELLEEQEAGDAD